MANDEGRNVSHSAASGSDTHFIISFASLSNLASLWPVFTTLLVLSANIGVYVFFSVRHLDATSFMGFEDYAANTVLGTVLFLLCSVGLSIITWGLALLIYGVMGIGRKKTDLARNDIDQKRFEAALRLSCLVCLAVVVFLVLVSLAARPVDMNGKSVAEIWGTIGPFYALVALFLLFLLSLVIRTIGPLAQRVSRFLQVLVFLLAPGLSAYVYFTDHTLPSNRHYSVDMKTVDIPLDSAGKPSTGHYKEQLQKLERCSRANRLIWMGSKALVIACGDVTQQEYMIIANPDGEHVSSYDDSNSSSNSSAAAMSMDASASAGVREAATSSSIDASSILPQKSVDSPKRRDSQSSSSVSRRQDDAKPQIKDNDKLLPPAQSEDNSKSVAQTTLKAVDSGARALASGGIAALNNLLQSGDLHNNNPKKGKDSAPKRGGEGGTVSAQPEKRSEGLSNKVSPAEIADSKGASSSSASQ